MTYADKFLHLEMFRLEHSAPFWHTCIASHGVTSNNYGKHFQDCVPADRAYAVVDVLRPLLRRAEWDAAGAGVCRRDELHLLLLFRQDRAGHVPGAASDARATAARLRDCGTADPEDWAAHAEDLCDPNRVAERVCHGPQPEARIRGRDPWDPWAAHRRRIGRRAGA